MNCLLKALVFGVDVCVLESYGAVVLLWLSFVG